MMNRLQSSSDMAEQVRQHDWASTPLGPLERLAGRAQDHRGAALCLKLPPSHRVGASIDDPL